MQQLRVFLITQEEPFYIPKVIRYLLQGQGPEYRIVGATVLRPHRKNKTMGHWLKERTRVYSWRDLAIAASFMGHARLTRGPLYSVAKTLKLEGVESIPASDINAPEYVRRLNRLGVDVIASVSPPQIFKRELLEVPRRHCLNAHGTLLPRHRGVFGSWWTLYTGDSEGGSTVHTMEDRLDAGDVIWQRAVSVDDDTQYSLAYKTKKLIAEGLVEVFRMLARDGELRAITPTYEESYHYAPTREEGRDFYRKGLRIIRWADRRYALAPSFHP